jgi:nitrous oxide reductase accessory protein NosL
MKRTILALIALSALAAACHERRETPMDESGIRARAADSPGDLQRQQPPPE